MTQLFNGVKFVYRSIEGYRLFHGLITCEFVVRIRNFYNGRHYYLRPEMVYGAETLAVKKDQKRSWMWRK